MLPARQSKVDMSKLTEEEKVLFRKYGAMPKNKNVMTQKLKERKYFDSGDYALSKAGKTEQVVGQVIPSPQSIHHHSIAVEEAEQAAPGIEGAEAKEGVASTGAGLPVIVNEHQITSPLSIVPPISAESDEPQDEPAEATTSDSAARDAQQPGVAVAVAVAAEDAEQPGAAAAAAAAARPVVGAGSPKAPSALPQLHRRASTNCPNHPQITRRQSIDGDKN